LWPELQRQNRTFSLVTVHSGRRSASARLPSFRLDLCKASMNTCLV
jgi:hypothetical protein